MPECRSYHSLRWSQRCCRSRTTHPVDHEGGEHIAHEVEGRDEELQMASVERQDKTAAAVTAAVKQYCGLPPAPPQPPPDAQAKADH